MTYFKITEKSVPENPSESGAERVLRAVQGVLPGTPLSVWKGIDSTLVDLTSEQVEHVKSVLDNVTVEVFVPHGFEAKSTAA